MSFIVDGAQWAFEGQEPARVHERVERFIRFVWESFERDEEVWIGDDFQFRAVLGGLDIWSLMYSDSAYKFPQGLAEQLTAWLGRAQFYTEQLIPPPDVHEIEISIDGGPSVPNLDVAWVHHLVRAGVAVASLSLVRSGPLITVTRAGEAIVFFVLDEPERLEFWRNAIVLCGDSEDCLLQFAARAFPDLYFVAGVLEHVGRLAGGYLAVRAGIRRSFAVLNDCGAWAFTGPPPATSPGEEITATGVLPPSQLIQHRLRLLGLDVAPENPNVYRNGGCRRAREVVVGDDTLYCEWHVKIEPHRNRIHIHPPTEASDGKLVIAIIAEHLPLPG